ncbi:MAG: hypothetical protein ACRED1_11780, partial [Limisphaerales bacterium]
AIAIRTAAMSGDWRNLLMLVETLKRQSRSPGWIGLSGADAKNSRSFLDSSAYIGLHGRADH